MKGEGVKMLVREVIIASWKRIGKPSKKEEVTNQYEKNRLYKYTTAVASIGMWQWVEV